MRYLRVSVITTSEFSDIVSNTLFELNTNGVAIKDQADVLESLKSPKNWDYIDETVVLDADPRVIVSGFFDETADIKHIAESIEILKNDGYFETGSLETSFSFEDSADWENEWRKYYKPITAGKLTIVPSWLSGGGKFDKNASVFIDPGLAFGTGNHETTAMCAEMLSAIDLKNKAVADIGCGSGILGICALKLGAKKCYFLDIDSDAVKASKNNAEFNGIIGKSEFICGDISVDLPKTFDIDIILANLTADLLIRLKPDAARLLKSGGIMIVGGILDGYQNKMFDAFINEFSVIKTEKRNNWYGVLYKKH